MAAGQQNIEMNDGIFRVQYLLTNDRAVQPTARKCSNDAEAFVEREDLIKCWQQQFSGCQNVPDCILAKFYFPAGLLFMERDTIIRFILTGKNRSMSPNKPQLWQEEVIICHTGHYLDFLANTPRAGATSSRQDSRIPWSHRLSLYIDSACSSQKHVASDVINPGLRFKHFPKLRKQCKLIENQFKMTMKSERC